MLRLFLYWVLLPVPAFATQVADSTVYLPALTVTAARLSVPSAEAPVRVQLLDRNEIIESGLLTIAEVLQERAPLYVRHYAGGLSTISQRGGTASQTLVLLDGLRIASPMLGQLDLSLLPTVMFDAIEVTSSASGALYGTDAMGGIVNMQTTPSKSKTSISTGTGTWGRRQATVYASHRQGQVYSTVAAGWDKFRGDYPYWNRALFPPRNTPREGGDQEKWSIFGSTQWMRENDQWRLSTWYNEAERGLPDINSTLPSGERQWDKHLRVWTQGRRDFKWGSVSASSIVHVGALRYLNPVVGIDDIGRTVLASTQIEIQTDPERTWRLGSGIEAGSGHADHPSLSNDNRVRHFAAFAFATSQLGRLILYPALRLDHYVRQVSVQTVNPRLGMNVRLSSRLRLKSSIASGFRMPTLNDLFWLPGGNPELRPERGWTYDIGVIWANGRLQGEVTGFVKRLRDQIVWQPLPAGYWGSLNVDRLVTRGLEISVDYNKRITPQAAIRGRVLWIYLSQVRGLFLRLIPRHEIKSHASVQWRFVSASISAAYTGPRAVTLETESAAFFLVHSKIRVHAGRVAVGFRVDNLFNTRYEYLPSNPMPPRHGRLDLTLNIN